MHFWDHSSNFMTAKARAAYDRRQAGNACGVYMKTPSPLGGIFGDISAVPCPHTNTYRLLTHALIMFTPASSRSAPVPSAPFGPSVRVFGAGNRAEQPYKSCECVRSVCWMFRCSFSLFALTAQPVISKSTALFWFVLAMSFLSTECKQLKIRNCCWNIR